MTQPKTKLTDLKPKISQPSLNALANIGIHYLEDIPAYTEHYIKNLHGVGPKTITQLHQIFTARGLSFASENKAEK